MRQLAAGHVPAHMCMWMHRSTGSKGWSVGTAGLQVAALGSHSHNSNNNMVKHA
jgi:hypothetical protein